MHISKTILAAAMIALTATAFAQPEGASSDELGKVREAALASRYSYDFVGRLCNQVGPRLSGSPGAEAAVEQVSEEMARLGLKVRLQPVMVPHWVRGEEKAAIVSYPGQRHKIEHAIHLCALGGSSATPAAGIEAEVLVVRSFTELEAIAPARVAGRIVLFDTAFDDVLAKNGNASRAYGQAVAYRVQGPARASKLGAAAALVRSVGGASYRLPHTGVTIFKDVAAIPAAAVSAEDADQIVYLARNGPVKLRLLLTPQMLPDAASFNVIGDLVGSQKPDEVVIVSGHLDSWDLGTGAIDDAAGVGMAMGTAQAMIGLNLHPRRTLRVIAWMNEENGGVGGKTYAQEESDIEHRQFAAIESDLGDGHPMGLEMLAKGSIEPWTTRLDSVRVALQPIGAGWILPATGTGSDISPLSEKGVVCFHPLVDARSYFDYHHTAADTFDKIDMRSMQENTAVMAVLADCLSNLSSH